MVRDNNNNKLRRVMCLAVVLILAMVSLSFADDSIFGDNSVPEAGEEIFGDVGGDTEAADAIMGSTNAKDLESAEDKPVDAIVDYNKENYEESSSWWIYLVIILVIIGVVVFIVMKRKKPRNPQPRMQQSMQNQEQMPPQEPLN